MKRIAMSVAFASILAIGGVLWHGGAQSQPHAKQAAHSPDPLADWLYPDAKNVGESNGERLPSIHLHGIQLQTNDTIDKVFHFFRKKTDPRFSPDHHNGWAQELQPALLMTQWQSGAHVWSLLSTHRKDADSALMIIHQPKRTITVQISRDAMDKSTTDILLVADEHAP